MTRGTIDLDLITVQFRRLFMLFLYTPLQAEGISQAEKKQRIFTLLIHALPVVLEGADSTAHNYSDFRVQGRVYPQRNTPEYVSKFQLSDRQKPAKKENIFFQHHIHHKTIDMRRD